MLNANPRLWVRVPRGPTSVSDRTSGTDSSRQSNLKTAALRTTYEEQIRAAREIIVILRTRAALCLAASVVSVVASGVLAGPAAAAGNPSGTGQPSQECGEDDATLRPGNSSSAAGSAFNPDGVAGTHYAGEQPQNSVNPKSVSQYDVACVQVSARG
jgi:hypothetical protein